MDYIIICLVAIIGSGLTLFSGFGLGTILLPVFGLFFPIEMAIALTAIVHFLNNLFKLGLLGLKANTQVVIQFGIPSVVAAFLGAHLLTLITEISPLFRYSLGDRIISIIPVKLIIGVLLMFFALFETLPRFKNIQFNRKYLPVGGLLSGFFGGLSGHQGALRSAFLIKANLPKEAFIASGVVIACMVDFTRLSIYSKQIFQSKDDFSYPLIVAATLSAFFGAYIGNRILKKTTIGFVQYIVATMIFVFAVLLILGIV